MILFRHELRQGWRSLILWTAAIAGFMGLISLLFPQVKDQMASINGLISTMGAFSDAFGLGKLNMGTFIGFYTVECQNVLGLGGALYAAILASNSLAKEEQAGTAEFLLTHPLSRASVVTSKALALVSQLLILNAVTLAVVLLSLTLMGESAPMGQSNLTPRVHRPLPEPVGLVRQTSRHRPRRRHRSGTCLLPSQPSRQYCPWPGRPQMAHTLRLRGRRRNHS